MVNSILIICTFLIAAPVLAQNEFERILLPVTVFNSPGAYGTVWNTEIWAHNDADVASAVFPITTSHAALSPHSDLPIPVFRPAPGVPPGQFIYVTRAIADRLSFNLRIYDSAHDAGDGGAELPVVREHEFFTG